MKFLKHGMKVVERRLRRIVSVDEMKFGFIPERGTTDAVFILRRMQEEYHAKGKSCICVLWIQIKLLTEYQGKCWNEQ